MKKHINRLSDIDVSLSQGQLYHTKHLIVLWLAFISSSLLIIMGIISLVLSCIKWDKKIFIVGVLCMLIGIMFFIISIFCLVKDNKAKRRIAIWLEDAVELKAHSQKINERRLGIQLKATKIQVNFTLNNDCYIVESTYKVFGGYEGCVGCFNKYANRDVNILYSAKYNEVMILKDVI